MTATRGLLAASFLGLAVTLGHGLGRFGYALIMPAMQSELHWGYELASWINTANAIGYVAGTVSGFVLLRQASTRRLFGAGLWMIAASLPLMAVDAGFAWLLLLRLLSGWGAAWVFSTGGALINELYGSDPARKGTATGLFYGGAGIGMMLTAAVAPPMLAALGAAAWPQVWVVLGLVAAVLLVFPLRVAQGGGGPSLAAVNSARVPLGSLAVTLVAYCGFAASHAGYVFFVFAWTRTQQIPWYHGACMWALMGAAVFVSAWIWQRPLARWRGEWSMALSCTLCAAAALLPAVHGSTFTIYLSAVLMGACLFTPPAAMTALARQTLPPEAWGKTLMVFALVFSLGQAAGSWAFGRAADLSSLSTVLGASSAGLLASAATAVISVLSARPATGAAPAR